MSRRRGMDGDVLPQEQQEESGSSEGTTLRACKRTRTDVMLETTDAVDYVIPTRPSTSTTNTTNTDVTETIPDLHCHESDFDDFDEDDNASADDTRTIDYNNTTLSPPSTNESMGDKPKKNAHDSDNDHVVGVAALVATLQQEQETTVIIVPDHDDVGTTTSATPDFAFVEQIDPHFAEYSPDIYRTWKAHEASRTTSPTYMETIQHTHLTPLMRAMSVDWMCEVHSRYPILPTSHHHTTTPPTDLHDIRLVPQTLVLAVDLLDRFLTVQPVSKRALQLVGVTCLLLASKYEEIEHMPFEEVLYVCDDQYSAEDVRKMEAHILRALEFRLSTCTAVHFLDRFVANGVVLAVRGGGVGVGNNNDWKQVYFASLMLVEMALVEYTSVGIPPSRLAAACLSVALTLNQLPPWSPLLEECSGYSLHDIDEHVRYIAAIAEGARTHPSELFAVFHKYSSSSRCHVSRLLPGTVIPH